MTAENARLEQSRDKKAAWKKWGPYLRERQWGTVREDYSEGGDAWNYFTHDQARSRAYRWGEDGLAGISDDQQRLCFALALWNGKDPILKKRLWYLAKFFERDKNSSLLRPPVGLHAGGKYTPGLFPRTQPCSPAREPGAAAPTAASTSANHTACSPRGSRPSAPSTSASS